MLIKHLDKKLLILRCCLYLIIALVFSVVWYNLYNSYQSVIHITAQDITNWLKKKNYNNVDVKIAKIQFNWSAIDLNFDLEKVTLKLNNDVITINKMTGKINVLSFIVYNKIKIADVVIADLYLSINNISPKQGIKELVGKIDCYGALNKNLNKNSSLIDINIFLSDSTNTNINFNIDTVINIDHINNNISINKFRLQNTTKNIRDIITYLPEYFINPVLLQWLDSALLSGEIGYNELLWTQDNQFNWKIKFKDVNLRYMHGWPLIENLYATMNIVNDDFKIHINSGDSKGFILQQSIQQISASLNNIYADNLEPLLIKLDILAPISKGLEFIKYINLQHVGNNFGKYINIFNPQGDMSLSIQILVPLAKNNKEDIKVIGNGVFTKTRITIPIINVTLDNLNSNVTFSNNNILIDNIKINIFNNIVPVTLTIKENHVFIESPGILVAKFLLNQHDVFIIDELSVFDNHLGKTKIFITPSNDALYFQNDYAKGKLLFSDLKINKHIIYFDELKLNTHNLINKYNNKNILSKINKISFNCKNFYLNAINMGEINGAITKDQGLQLEGKANFKDFNINIPIIHNGSGVIDFNLRWLNGIHGFLWKNASGILNIEVKNGVIVGIEPGLGRVIGLLSIENIQRRLHLDFTDVTNAGFSFDQLTGKLCIESGVINIEHMIIQGPSAKMVITGAVNLETQDLHLFVEVSSKIGSTLPIAAAIAAGNPVIGAAVWLFDRASGAKISELQVEKYKVVGTWEKPEIIEL